MHRKNATESIAKISLAKTIAALSLPRYGSTTLLKK